MGKAENTHLTLEVNIATWRPDGLLKVEAMRLPEVDGVRYIVSWQDYGEAPLIPLSLSVRQDVEILLCQCSGQSINRNNALRHSCADIILIADDDLRYTPEQLQTVIQVFGANPSVDVATFRHSGVPRCYPSQECDLGKRLPKGYSVAAFEIAFRREAVGDLMFDERFGFGSRYFGASEDEKFLLDARRRGLHCRFFPVVITSHHGPTTGDRRVTSCKVAAAMGKYISLEYPFSWPLRIPLKAWREWRRGGRFFFTFCHMLRGVAISGR